MDFFTKKISLQQRLIQHELQLYPLVGSCLELRDEDIHRYPRKPLDLSLTKNWQANFQITAEELPKVCEYNLSLNNSSMDESKGVLNRVISPINCQEECNGNQEFDLQSVDDNVVTYEYIIDITDDEDVIDKENDGDKTTKISGNEDCVKRDFAFDMSFQTDMSCHKGMPCHKANNTDSTRFNLSTIDKSDVQIENLNCDISIEKSPTSGKYTCSYSSDRYQDMTSETYTNVTVSAPEVNGITTKANSFVQEESTISSCSLVSNASFDRLKYPVTASNNVQHSETIQSHTPVVRMRNGETVQDHSSTENISQSSERTKNASHVSCTGTCRGHDVNPGLLSTGNRLSPKNSVTKVKNTHHKRQQRFVQPHKSLHLIPINNHAQRCSSCRACNRIMAKLSNIK